MFGLTGGKDNRTEFVARIQAQRDAEHEQKRQETAAAIINRQIRRFLSNRRLRQRFCEEFDGAFVAGDPFTLAPTQVFTIARRLLFVYREKEDESRLLAMCRYMAQALSSQDAKKSQVMVALNKKHVSVWPSFVNALLHNVNRQLEVFSNAQMKTLPTLLHFCLTVTSTNTWALLKSNEQLEKLRSLLNTMTKSFLDFFVKEEAIAHLGNAMSKCIDKPTLPSITIDSIRAALVLLIRMLPPTPEASGTFVPFTQHIMTLPALVQHLDGNADSTMLLKKHMIFERTLYCVQSGREWLKTLPPTKALCLLGNIVQLADNADDDTLIRLLFDFANTARMLLNCCAGAGARGQARSKQTNFHSVLGWCNESVDAATQNAMPAGDERTVLLFSYIGHF